MPQAYEAGAVFLARAVLEQDELDRLELAALLSPSQLARMRRIMQAAHQIRRIPAGDQAFLERSRERGDVRRTIVIDDDRLCYIWNRFREYALLVAKALILRADGLPFARQLVKAFQTRECRALLRDFRAQYDRRNDGSDERAARLRKAILAYVDAQVDPPHSPGFLQALFDR